MKGKGDRLREFFFEWGALATGKSPIVNLGVRDMYQWGTILGKIVYHG